MLSLTVADRPAERVDHLARRADHVVDHGLQRLAGDRVDLECQPFSLSPEPRVFRPARRPDEAPEQTISATATSAGLAICSRNTQVRIGGILHDCSGNLKCARAGSLEGAAESC
jgi:hypothetical protein